MTSVNLDGAKLQKAFGANETTRIVLEHLVSRKRDRTFVDLIRLRHKLIEEGLKISDTDYDQLWVDLKDQGIGTIIVGRRGGANRFDLGFSLKRLALAAHSGRREELARIKKAQAEKPVVEQAPAPKPVAAPKPAPIVKSGQKPLVMQIPFGAERGATLKMPADISQAEGEILKKTINRMFGG